MMHVHLWIKKHFLFLHQNLFLVLNVMKRTTKKKNDIPRVGCDLVRLLVIFVVFSGDWNSPAVRDSSNETAPASQKKKKNKKLSLICCFC